MKDVLQEQRLIKTTELRANKGQLVERGIPTNPRKITKDKYNLLLQSLDKSNLTQIRPLDVIEHEGKFIVLSGNQRLRALKELKVKEVPCNVLRDDLEPETYRQIVLQANTNYGEHDDDLLANEWDAVELHEWGYDLPEWETEKIEEETQGDDDVPESAPAITVEGDLYLLGEHRLLCGDSTMIDDVEKLMDGEKVDSLQCDPPYGVDYSSKNEFLNKFEKGNSNQKAINNDAIKNYRKFFSDFLSIIPFAEYNTIYCWMSGLELHNLRLAFDDCEIKWGDYLVWLKNNHVLGRKDYNAKHEFCVYGWKNKHKFYGDFSTTILEFPKPLKNDLHPTMKPIELISKLIKDGSKKGGLVYDAFLGSGSTLIACEKTNRKCYGMELDEKYCDVIVKRYIEFCVKNNKEAKVYRNGELISNDVFLVE